MSRFHALITNFIFGETTPRVAARVAGDSLFGMSAADVYRSGCREVTNMLILPQGGAYRREGFRFGRDVAVDIGPGDGNYYRLFTLRDETEDLLLLLTPGQISVYRLSSFQLVGLIATPFTQSELLDIGVAQYEAQVVIYSSHHRPRRLEFKPEVRLIDPGTDFIAPLYSYGDANSPIPQTVTATYVANVVGIYLPVIFSVSGVRPTNSHGNVFQAQIFLSDAGSSVVNIQTALDNITAIVPHSASCTYDSTSGTEMTFTIEYKYYASRGDGSGLLAADEGTVTMDTLVVGDAEPLWSGPFMLYHNGIYWECIAAHVSAAVNEPGVGADFDSFWIGRGTTAPISGYIDYDVLDGSWALEVPYAPRGRGWPAAMGFHEQRLVGAGPTGARSVIAGAKIGGAKELFNFTLGVNDNDGLLYKLASADNAVIRWFISSGKLFIGTSGGVFVQLAQPWTPTNVSFIRINGYNASLHVPAVEVDGDMFFPTIDDRQVRQVQYINDLQTWNSWDLLCFAEHLFTDQKRIKQLVSHQGVETYLWAVRTDGALMCMTYLPSQGTYHALAWHKHGLSDRVIQVATGFDGNRFVTVALVNRVIYDAAAGVFDKHAMLEVLDNTSQNLFDAEPTFFEQVVDLDPALEWVRRVYTGPEWSVHLDSYERLGGNGTGRLTVSQRFVGRPVQLVEDGAYLGQFIPDATGGIDVVTVAGSLVLVGFGYVSRIEPNRLESQSAMTTQSQKIRWVKPVLRLITSALPKVNGVRPNERTQDDEYDTATGLFSGDASAVTFGSDGRLVIEQDLPLPLHLTGIFGLMTTEEG